MVIETGVGKYLPNLQHLIIDVRGCKGANYGMKDRIRATWNFLSKIEIY